MITLTGRRRIPTPVLPPMTTTIRTETAIHARMIKGIPMRTSTRQ
jgi:hypothetical protein